MKYLRNVIGANSLKGKLARGGVVLVGGAVFEHGTRLLRNIILTRLLVPEDFGLVATVIAVSTAFQAMTEIGVRQSIIQNKRGNSSEFLNVAWWFSSVRGSGLFVMGFLIAPLLAQFYGKPELLMPLRVSFLSFLFYGITSPRIHVLEKEFRYFRWVVLKQGAAIVNVAVAVLGSFYFRNIWPLIMGFTLEFAATFVLSYVLCSFRPQLSLNKPDLGEILKYARGMLGLPILTAVFLEIDILVIGKLLTMEELGMYSLAKGLASLPTVVFVKTVRPLILPAFSQLQDDQETLQGALFKMTNVMATCVMPIILCCVVFSGPILGVIYGSQYRVVSVPFSILMISAMISLYSGILVQIYFALARPDLQRAFALIRLALAGILLYPCTVIFRLVGASSVMLISVSLLAAMQLIWAEKLVGIRMNSYFKSLVRGFLISSFIVALGLALRTLLPGKDITLISVGGVLCIIVILFSMKDYLGREHLPELYFQTKSRG